MEHIYNALYSTQAAALWGIGGFFSTPNSIAQALIPMTSVREPLSTEA